MKHLKVWLFSMLLCGAAFGQVDTNAHHFWMMTYFWNSAEGAGPRLAFSSDSATGIQWQKYNNEAVLFAPSLPAPNNLCRDPMIAFDATNKVFHMVWTVAWTGTIIGHSSSKNLKNWTTQVGLPVAANIPGTTCCWAPEIFWDDVQSKWMIYWSTDVNNTGKRIWSVTTTNFSTLSAPVKIFDPGYTVIDADILKVAAGNYYMVFKDERNSSGSLVAKNIHYTTCSTPQGAYSTAVSAAIANTGTEGPCLIKVGDDYRCYFDPFSTTTTYRMVHTTNLATTSSPWPDGGILKSGTANFTYSHSNIIEVPRSFVMFMLFNKPLQPSDTTPNTSINYFPTLKPRSNMYNEGNPSFVKMFDLSGRLVSIDRIGQGEILGASYGRLPAGFYIRTAGSMKNKMAKVTK